MKGTREAISDVKSMRIKQNSKWKQKENSQKKNAEESVNNEVKQDAKIEVAQQAIQSHPMSEPKVNDVAKDLIDDSVNQLKLDVEANAKEKVKNQTRPNSPKMKFGNYKFTLATKEQTSGNDTNSVAIDVNVIPGLIIPPATE